MQHGCSGRQRLRCDGDQKSRSTIHHPFSVPHTCLIMCCVLFPSLSPPSPSSPSPPLTYTQDIPLQPPAVCRDVSVLHLKGTPKVMSSSAPERFPLNMFTGRGTPILTPVQRLLFKTPDVFGSVQHHGGQRGRQEKSTPTHPLSVARGQAAVVNPVPRDPFADFLESGSRVPQRPEGAVRIGSGQTPMRMRHKPRIPQEEMDQSGFTARKAKSFSPIRSSPMGPHYSRSWSTVFCDPLVNDDTILESMGEPLLPEKCIELVWTEDPSK